MKKYIAILVVVVMTVAGCSSAKNNAQNSDIIQFDYKAYTRGSNKEVTVTRDKVEVKEVKLGKNVEATYPLSKANWNRLVEMAQKIKLDKMETLEAPSKKHQFDGAMAANLTITSGSTTYQSVTFDDGNPPSEIKGLVEEIIGISGIGKIEVKE